MKRKTIFTFVVVAVAATVCFALDYILGTDGVFGGGAMAFAALAGATETQTHTGSKPFIGETGVGPVSQVGTHTIVEDENGKPAVGPGPEMNKATVSTKLSKLMPSNYPIDTFLRQIGKGSTNSDKYEFYSIVARGVKAKLKEQSSAETDSPVTLKLSEGIQSLSLDGDLLVPTYNVSTASGSPVATKVADGVAVRPLQLHIVGIDYGKKTIDVIGINAPAPAMDADTEIYRMASAKDQDAAISNDPMATPTKDFNFCQRNLCTISENAFQALQDKEIDYGMTEFKEQALYDFRYQAEITSIFGSTYHKGDLIDPNTQKRKLHMRGLMDFGIQTIARGAEETVEEFLNRSQQQIFSNNNGSEKRLLLYGPEFATELANSGAWSKQLEAGKTEVKWGITWKTIESNFGTVLGLMHNTLGMVGYGRAAILIDPANVRRIEQVPLSMQDLDLKKAGIRNSKDVLLEEAWTLEVTNPATHAVLFI